MSNYNDDGKGPLRTIIFVIALAIGCLIYSALTSCSVQSHMARRPDKALKACVTMWPPVVTTTTNTEYLPGKIDTLPGEVRYVDCDSVINESQQNPKVLTKRVAIACPPSTRQIDSVIKTVTITKTNTAKEQLLQKENAGLKSDNDRLKKDKRTWMIVGMVGIVIILGGAALKIFTKVKLF